MTPDIWRRIKADFGPDAPIAEEAINELCAKTKDLIEVRLLRCIIFLSQGDIQNLKGVIRLAATDYRDVIWQAEYDCTDVQKRDFTKPFAKENSLTTIRPTEPPTSVQLP